MSKKKTEAELAAEKAAAEAIKAAEAANQNAPNDGENESELAAKAEAAKAQGDVPAKPADGDEKKAKKPAAEKSADAQMVADVFAGNPTADEIFVVDGMPFLTKTHALNFAKGDEAKVRTHKRG